MSKKIFFLGLFSSPFFSFLFPHTLQRIGTQHKNSKKTRDANIHLNFLLCVCPELFVLSWIFFFFFQRYEDSLELFTKLIASHPEDLSVLSNLVIAGSYAGFLYIFFFSLLFFASDLLFRLSLSPCVCLIFVFSKVHNAI